MSARATALALLAVAACAAPPAPVPAPVVPTGAAPAVTAAVTAAPPAPTAIASAAPVASATPAAPASPCPEGMAYLPAGEYVFGQTAKQTVKVAAFCLDLNEVSTDAYTACVKGGKCDGGYTTVCDPSTAGKDGRGKMPMVCVDFPQADRYCAAQGKRLPSTEEWEWAARGASASAPHPWGDADLGDQICWSGKAKRELPCEIGSFPGGDSPQGVHDLLGGVFEWTTSSADATSVNRIVRGGSWKDGDKPLFAVARQGVFKTTYRCGFVGIRCAQAAPGPAR
jgi:formylglycine-generating enzyme required for sulfatase activity